MAYRITGILVLVLLLIACRSHVARIYSGVDPDVKPSKLEPIVFDLPKDPSIRERNVAVVLKDELARNGFNLVDDTKLSTWILTFNVDRQTYTIGTTSSGMVFAPSNASVAATSSQTRYVNQTDMVIYLYLIRTNDVQKEKPMAMWEGVVRVKDEAYKRYPNAAIKNLLDQFGKNVERTIKIDSDYQKELAKPKTQ